MSIMIDGRPDYSRSESALNGAGTGRHRGRRADGDWWVPGAEAVGHGRHRRTTHVVRPAPADNLDGEPARQPLPFTT